LTTGKNQVDFSCQNGESVKWSVFLNRARTAFKMSTQKEALNELKKRVGIEVVEKIEYPPMDKEYFADMDKLRKDLKGYVDKMELESINDLTTGKNQVDFSCQNGESVKWCAFLSRARIAFEMSKHTEVLNELKKRVGIEIVEKIECPPMDKEYFSDVDKLRKDLKGYVDKMELESINKLTTGRVNTLSNCQNGESVKWTTFLDRAVKAFRMSGKKKALNELKKRVGIEVVEKIEYPPMDKEYFADVDKLRKDLEGYLRKMKLESIKKLTTGRVNTLSNCQNGESVKWTTFLDRAVKAFRMSGKKKALNELKKRVGIEVVEKIEYPPMDKEYFADVDKLRKDLEGYVRKMKLESINKLTAGKKQVDFSCQNGESVQWGTFLNRAAKVFGMRTYIEPLNKLKKSLGIEVVECPPMDKEYFADVVNLRKDLEGYVRKMKLESINKLTAGKKQVDFSCQNGESVKWATFLDRALRAFGMRMSKPSEVLNELKKRVGIEVVEKIEYSPMDKEYFADVDKLRKDLKGYVDKMKLESINKLTTGRVNTLSNCQNGESVKWTTFLKRAVKAFRMSGQKEALDMLKERVQN
ncbi:MAG: hypothetical protein P1V18_06430, partial [Candidatus Gracilibacteria bacterium]|nr:hypothetical protein [Candidatus Gracilibacteria bacterium]